MSFSSGFITGRSISRRTGGGGGFGGSALSVATMSQKARGVIRPEPAPGGGSSDPFKTALREIVDPTFEWLMDAESPAGTPTNTGTDPLNNAELSGCETTAEADPVGGFDGYVEIDAASDYLRQGVGGHFAKIGKSADRSWIFVFDVINEDLANGYLNFGTQAGSDNAWGWMYAGTTGGGGTSGIFTSRYFWSGTAVSLSSGNGTHSSLGSATDMLTAAIDESTPRRTVLIISYDQEDDPVGVIRWKQTNDPAGHTYISDDAPEDGGYTSLHVRWAGFGSSGVTGIKWKYIGIVNQVLTAANFDTLADIALGN